MWWTEDGCHILSSHSDGSYCRWTVGEGDVNEDEEKSDIPYGEDKRVSYTCTFAFPVAYEAWFSGMMMTCLFIAAGHFPCKAISKIVQLPTKEG